MSTEVRKRGRPKKLAVETPMLTAEKTPKPETSRTSRTSTKKVATSTTKRTASKSNGFSGTIEGKQEVPEDVLQPAKPSKAVNTSPAASAEAPPPPPSVIHAIAIEESRILKEIVQAEDKRQRSSARLVKKPATTTPLAEVVPPIQESTAPAFHLQPTNTLAMGFPIPTYQSSTHNLGLQPICLPWLPNPSPLRQTAYLSTTTPMHSAKKRLASIKEANRFVVTEQSTRGGPGSGAASSRLQQAAEEARGTAGERFPQPSDMPAKYKPALRRVQAIIVALPIVIVTSYILYERLLGVEQKKVPRLPSGTAANAQPSTGSNDIAGSL